MKLRITALLLCLACALAFGACGESGTPAGETHTHTPCAVCGLCTDPDCPGEESEKCKGHTPVNPPEEEAELKGMAEYFSGVKIVTERETLTDENGQEKSFEELLDRQLDVFAQDIIYRLTYVYGYNDSHPNHTENGSLNLKNPDNTNYSLNNALAKIFNRSLLVTTDAEHIHSVYNADCLDCFQLSMLTNENHFLSPERIYLAGAIEGRYSELSDENVNSLKYITSQKWNWTIENATYQNFSAAYKNNMKMAFAQILANETAGGIYAETTYNELLKQIKTLGFGETFKTALVSFIQNTVIGEKLIEKDQTVFNCAYFRENGYLIDAAFQMKAPYNDTEQFTQEEIENSPRLYKGYNIVIPAIVERAVANTFENTETCLYPAAGRNVVRVSPNYETALAGGETFVLMPKAGAPLTALSLELEGQSGQSVTLSLEISVGGKVMPISKTIVLTGGKQTEEIDVSPAGSAFGAYDGNLQPTESNALFGNAGGADSHGSNYILLTASGGNSLAFKGLYDK